MSLSFVMIYRICEFGGKKFMLEWDFILLLFVLNPCLVFMNKHRDQHLTYHSIHAFRRYSMDYLI